MATLSLWTCLKPAQRGRCRTEDPHHKMRKDAWAKRAGQAFDGCRAHLPMRPKVSGCELPEPSSEEPGRGAPPFLQGLRLGLLLPLLCTRHTSKLCGKPALSQPRQGQSRAGTGVHSKDKRREAVPLRWHHGRGQPPAAPLRDGSGTKKLPPGLWTLGSCISESTLHRSSRLPPGAGE